MADLSLRENRQRVVAEYIAKRHYPKPTGKSAEITHISLIQNKGATGVTP